MDDNSPDGTSAIVAEIAKDCDKVRLITRHENRGLIPSIRDGIQAAHGNIVVWMDADQSMQPSVVPILLSKIRDGADLAFGSRYVEGGAGKGAGDNPWNLFQFLGNIRKSQDSFSAVLISILGNAVMRYVLDKRFFDYTSGFYAVRKPVLEHIGLEGHYLDYCITFLHKVNIHGYRISEVPMTVLVRKEGESKTSSGLFDLFPIIFHCYKAVRRLKKYEKLHRKQNAVCHDQNIDR